MSNIRQNCPKCEMGTLTDGPHYKYDGYHGESLTWYCSACHYGESEPTKDAKPNADELRSLADGVYIGKCRHFLEEMQEAIGCVVSSPLNGLVCALEQVRNDPWFFESFEKAVDLFRDALCDKKTVFF